MEIVGIYEDAGKSGKSIEGRPAFKKMLSDDTIVELEERIEDAKLRKSSIEMETITLDNIYKLMLNFGKLYDIIK